ncbi:MAG: pilus assembly protein [Rhodospirillales bacterium]|nr:pilus assembly protein [Rhodospirillales bacterium]
MMPTRRHKRLLHGEEGTSSVEFALIVVVFFMFIFGITDFGRALWEWNRSSQATQAAVREAVVQDLVSDYLATLVGTNFAGGTVGACLDPVNVTSPITCTSTGCLPEAATNSTAFDKIVAVAQRYSDHITPQNVVVEYRYDTCLGFVGNPVGPDVDPMVTVRLQNMVFTFVTPAILGLAPTLAMPDFAATLPGEDHKS